MDDDLYGYDFLPLPDITVYELAQIMALHLYRVRDAEAIEKAVPKACLRHMRKFRFDVPTGEKEYCE